MVFLVGPEPDVQRIPAHSSVLADASPVFRAMFAGEMAARQRQQQQQQQHRVTVHCSPAGSAKTALALAPPSPLVKRRSGATVAPKSTVAVSDVDGRAFDVLLR